MYCTVLVALWLFFFHLCVSGSCTVQYTVVHCRLSYGHFDILSDESVRQGLKQYSSWPTYPQLYARGRLVGGVDIVSQMRADGSLLAELRAAFDTLPSSSQ